MDLKKSNNPARAIQWHGKSLAICSRKELIECVVELMKQLAIARSQGDQKENQNA
jgi:hypothetical protein